MAYLKTETITVRNDGIFNSFKLKINVDTKGRFYGYVPDYVRPGIRGVFQTNMYEFKDDSTKVYSDTLEGLVGSAAKALAISVRPEVSEEAVIVYNIKSHIVFAEDSEGTIFPNARFDGAAWPDNPGMYGDHSAIHPVRGGYSLTVGAKAMLKITYKYGKKSEIKYLLYYKGESHLEHDNPAQMLNSWCSMDLGSDPKEIPYSDEAARFFYSLMMGMARLAQTIQEGTFDQDKLQKLIASGDTSLLQHL